MAGTHFKGIVHSELGFDGPGTVPSGGTTGQVLKKASNDDQDLVWGSGSTITGSFNQLTYFNGVGDLSELPGFQRDTTSGGLNTSLEINPNNGGGGGTVHTWSLEINPIQNSNSENWIVHNINVNVDQDNDGFSLGVGGQAATILNMGYNHQGSSDLGSMTYINMNSDIGNGTDTLEIGGFNFINGIINVDANVTLNNGLQGYGFQPTVSATAVTGTNFYVNAFYDFANIGISVSGYNSVSLSPTVEQLNNNSGFTGINLNPTVDTFQGNSNFTGIGISGNLGTFSTGSYQGIVINSTVDSVTNATGIFVDMSNVTGTNVMAASFTGDVSITGDLSFTGALSIGKLQAFFSDNPVDGGGNPTTLHSLTTQMVAQNGVTTANADTIGVNTAMLITLEDNSVTTSGVFGLGFSALALPCVVETHTGATLDYMSAAVYALNFSGTSTGGTIEEANICRTVAVPNGITTVDRLRGFYYHEPFGGIGTVRHGFYIEDAPQNYIETALLIGGTPVSDDEITNSSVALEINSTTRAFLNARMTTTQRDAMTAVNGMQIYNSSTDKLQVYAAGVWVDLH